MRENTALQLSTEALSEVSAVVTPPVPEVARWLRSLGSGEVPLLTVEADESYRRAVYSWCCSVEVAKWRSKGVRGEVVTTALQTIEPCLGQLLQTENLLIEEPLKSMVDQSFYLVSDLFRVILEARFQVVEGSNATDFASSIMRWILDEKLNAQDLKLFEAAHVSRRVTLNEQLDLVCFLATLANQTGILDTLTFALDNVEMAATAGIKDRRVLLKELDDVAFTATRWEKLGSPLGVVLGVDRFSPLENSAPKLSKLLRSGVVHHPLV